MVVNFYEYINKSIFYLAFMLRDNKETLFQLLSGIIIIAGVFLKSSILMISGVLPVLLSIWFWYRENLNIPIKELEREVKELRKDLNTRKELENIKVRLNLLENVNSKK